MNNSVSVLSLLFLFLIFSNFQCDEPCEEIIQQRFFTFPIDFKPFAQKEFAVADTLWLSANFDALLNIENKRNAFDLNGGRGSITMEAFQIEEGSKNLQGGAAFLKIIEQFGEIEFERERSINGQFTSDSTVLSRIYVRFDCDGNCDFRFGIVPEQKGIYALVVHGGDFWDSERNNNINCVDDNIFNPPILNVENLNTSVLAEEAGLETELEFSRPEATIRNPQKLTIDSERTFFFTVK